MKTKVKQQTHLKQGRFGLIADSWDEKNIGEFAQTSSGGTPKRGNKEFYKNGNINWFKTGELGSKYIYESEEKITEIALEKSSAKLFPKDTLLVAMYGATIGDLSILKNESATNQACCGIFPNDNYDTEYLFYQLNFLKKQLVRRGAGGAQPNISQEVIKTFPVPFPEKKEQQKIADVLSTWDRAIELKESLIQEKEEQKKGLMQSLLTTKSSWKIKSLGELVSGTKGKAVQLEENGRYPVLGIQYLNGESEPNYTYDDTILAEKNDILLLWDGANAGSIYTEFEGAVGSTFMRLRPRDVNSIFIREYMRKDASYIKSIREGSGIPHVPSDFLSYYKVSLPDLPEQHRIAKILSTADREIELLKQEVEQLKEQKKGLMQL